jgi:hypothetical protein
MRQVIVLMALAGMALGIQPAHAAADERAEWGVAVSVGADSGSATLLMRNDDGYHLVVVDAEASIVGAGLGAMTLTDIRPGDRIDYAVSTWAGADIAEALHVTPRRQAEVRH